jgi:ankyrin repeat protein
VSLKLINLVPKRGCELGVFFVVVDFFAREILRADDVDVIRLLHANGVDVMATDCEGQTGLHLAASRGHIK